MREKRSCSNCIKGASIAINNDVLCMYNGAVSPDYVCSKHKYMPISSSSPNMNKCIYCENFIPRTDASGEESSIGLCRLFSVREYDGSLRNACSKHVRKAEFKVS